MILSIHIPKTAGQSFRLRLESTFASRALFDYGDWVGFDNPDVVARRDLRRTEMRARKDELVRDYDVIHGHFTADKYIGLFPAARFVAFFRDPYQQTVSHYHFLLRRPEIDHPLVRLFHEQRMSLLDLIAFLPDLQSMFLGRITVSDLAMVGVVEQYERSVRLFEAVFGRRLAPERARKNVNPDRQGDIYAIDMDVRRAIDRHRAGDIERYRFACERFERLAAHYGV